MEEEIQKSTFVSPQEKHPGFWFVFYSWLPFLSLHILLIWHKEEAWDWMYPLLSRDLKGSQGIFTLQVTIDSYIEH